MNDLPEDEPLDPAVEAIRVKMVRLLAVSGGIMMLGLMAVLFGIVYKINQTDNAKIVPPPVAKLVDLKIPKGSKVVRSEIQDDRIVLNLSLVEGGTMIRIFKRDGRLVSSYSISEE